MARGGAFGTVSGYGWPCITFLARNHPEHAAKNAGKTTLIGRFFCSSNKILTMALLDSFAYLVTGKSATLLILLSYSPFIVVL
jgi:hypothetical protein